MTNPYQAPNEDLQPAEPPIDGPRTRHGCVTAWLVLMIIVNSITVVTTLAISDEITSQLPSMPSWGIPVLAVSGVANVIFSVLLLTWKKIGFFGFVATSLVAAVVNSMAGLEIGQIVLGLVSVGILYAILQIGSPKTAWSQLE